MDGVAQRRPALHSNVPKCAETLGYRLRGQQTFAFDGVCVAAPQSKHICPQHWYTWKNVQLPTNLGRSADLALAHVVCPPIKSAACWLDVKQLDIPQQPASQPIIDRGAFGLVLMYSQEASVTTYACWHAIDMTSSKGRLRQIIVCTSRLGALSPSSTLLPRPLPT